MSKQRERSRLAERGAWGTVEYVVLRNGQCPAEDFVSGLVIQDKARLARLLNRMAMLGRICNEEQFKKEAGEIYCFKFFQIRIGCFRVGNKWLLTHGFRKKRDKWPQSELGRAERIRRDYLDTD